MPYRMMLVVAVALLIPASTSAFQAKPVDLTGTWTGSFTRSTGGEPGEAYIVLKQKGTEVTGTAGPGRDRQVAIANGKVTTVKGVTSVTFDATQSNGSVMKFDLKLVDGRLKGKATADANGEKREAILDVGRAK